MMKAKIFFLNGNKYLVKQQITIFELLNYFNYKNNLFVLEYNNKILNKENWNKLYIQNNDIIEIITVVGGG